MILYYLQCASIVFYSVLLGRLLRLDIVLILLFAVVYLIFKERKQRRWGTVVAFLDFVIIELLYYKNPFQVHIDLSYTVTYVVQLMVIFVITGIIVLVSMPYVRSNDTNEELKRANHLIRIFVAQITHELRTPLDSIHHVSQLLRKELRKDPSMRKIEPLVEIGWTVSSTARNIVNNVLDLAEIEAGKTPVIVKEAFKVRPFFEKILVVHRLIAESAKMQLELKVDPSMPAVIFGDPLNINQVLTNLLANAIKYGSDKFPIMVTISAQETFWELRVANHGEGIPPSRIKEVFDLFVTTRTGYIQGSGLGLYIVKTKVELMGGLVRVESQPQEQTVFSVILPLQEGNLRHLPDGAGSDLETGDLEKIKVLVAEDDKLTSFLLSRFLEDIGCSFTIVKNGRELLDIAEKKCQDDCPDIIMLDCHMPVLNGVETIRLLKQNPALRHVPIIVATGDLYSERLDEMLSAGANTYIKKPIDHNALKKTILLYIKKLPQN
jgi:signal transduction histidine kinase/ActR/RegA family two-component response regulator